VEETLIAELRSFLGNTATNVRFWLRESSKNNGKTDIISDSVGNFIAELRDSVDKNVGLFEDDSDTSANTLEKRVATSNIFWENYKRAKKLLDTAKIFASKSEMKELLLSPASLEVSKEQESALDLFVSFYQRAGFLFIASLESFVDTIYGALLKEEFRHNLFQSMVGRADLQRKILTIHLYCRGFDKAALEICSNLWNEIDELRKYRNDKFHGNVLDEHDSHILLEDGIFFVYHPSLEFRGRKAEKKGGKRFRISKPMGSETVSEIQEVVDALVDVTLSAMNEETRGWVQSWLHESMIPLLGEKQG